MTASKEVTLGTYEKRVRLPSRTAAGVAALMMETDMKTSKQNKCINLQE